MDTELPRDTNGDMDWNTLGNLLTAHILGEVLHAKYKDFKYGCVSREMHSVDTDWRFCYEDGDVVVLKKIYSDSPLHAFMGRGLIDLPMEDVVLYLKNISHREQWDKHLVDIEILRELSSTDFLVHTHHKARKCLIRAERDWLYYERVCYVDDKFVMTVLSVDLPEYPPTPGLTRGQLLPGTGWVVEQYDGSSSTTLVSYMAHLDPKALPPIIANKTIQKQVMAVRYIRDILTCCSPHPSPSPTPLHRKRQPKMRKEKGRGRGLNDRKGAKVKKSSTDDSQSLQLEDARGGQFEDGTQQSGVRFEDPISIYAFTEGASERRIQYGRMESVPWDIHHRWDGDRHNHTHLKALEVSSKNERTRSYSEGDSASLHSISVVKPGKNEFNDPKVNDPLT